MCLQISPLPTHLLRAFLSSPAAAPTCLLLKYLGVAIAWIITCAIAVLALQLPLWTLLLCALVLMLIAAAFIRQFASLLSQQEVRARQRGFDDLFEGHPLPQWIYDLDTQRLLVANRAALQLLGHTPAQLQGLGLGDLFEAPYDHRPPVGRFRLRGASNRKTLRVEVRAGQCWHAGRSCGVMVALSRAYGAEGSGEQGELFGVLDFHPEDQSTARGRDDWEAHLARVHPEDRKQVEWVHERVWQSGQETHDYRVTRLGQIRHVFERLQVRIDTRTGRQSLHVAFMDVSELRSLQGASVSQQRLYERMINGLPDGVVILRGERVHYANEAALRMFRVQRREANTLFAQFIHPDDRSREVDRELALQRGLIDESLLRQVRLVRADGNPFEAEVVETRLDTPDQPDVQLLIRDVSQNRRMERDLKDANKRLQALSQRLIEVQEAERRQLAGDLHDDVGQQLTGLKLHWQLLMRQLEDSPHLQAQAAGLTDTLDGLLATIRRLSLNLHPLQLENLGLEAAIRSHLGRFLAGTSLDWTFDVQGDLSTLSPQKALVAFRIFQEAVTNVVRHARATRVQVALKRREDGLHLHFVDDGIGFDVPAAIQRAQSLGLTSMHERVASLRGEVKIASLKGAGTRISVLLPKTFTHEERSIDVSRRTG